MLVTLRLHDPEGQGRIDQVQFGHGLLDEFIPVRKDEGTATTSLDQESKDNGFACPRGQYEQGTLHPRAVAASKAATASY